jgi:hypothetical protein
MHYISISRCVILVFVCVYRLVCSSGRLEEFIFLSLGVWGPKCPGLRNPEFPDIIRRRQWRQSRIVVVVVVVVR